MKTLNLEEQHTVHVGATMPVLALIFIVTSSNLAFTLNGLPHPSAAHVSENEINFVYSVAGSFSEQVRPREIDG